MFLVIYQYNYLYCTVKTEWVVIGMSVLFGEILAKNLQQQGVVNKMQVPHWGFRVHEVIWNFSLANF